MADLDVAGLRERWVTLECERVLYLDQGQNAILCDRLPSPVTLVVKLSDKSDAPTIERQP